jgi:hypothetical protein
VVLGDGGCEVPVVTENFSSDGVLLYADQLIPEGSEAGLILALPRTEETERVWCFGKVLRVEKDLREGKLGIAVAFQRYQVLSQV